MFLDFNETINNKITKKRIPSLVLEQMSKDLPDNLFYDSDDNGFAFLSGFREVDDLIFEIPDEIREEKKDSEITIEDILLYSYNGQKTIKLKTKNEGFIKVDNNNIPVEKFIQSLNIRNRIEKGAFYITPPAFPPKDTIKLSNDEYEKELTIERVPNLSIKYYKYEAYCKGISIIMSIPFSNSDNALFKISYNIDEIKSYKELIECLSLYNSVIKGEGKLNNYELKHQNVGAKGVSDELIVFLKKVQSIENHLNCKFDLYAGDISYGMAREVEGLYQNLIEKKPIKNYKKIDSITFDDDPNKTASEEKSYYLLYQTILKKEVLGIELELPTIVSIFNIKYKFSKKKELWKADIIYNSDSFSSIISFKSKEELDNYVDEYKKIAEKMSEYVDVISLLP